MTTSGDHLAIKPNQTSVDEPLKKGEEAEQNEEEKEEEFEKQPLSEYFKPQFLYIILQKRWLPLSAISTLIYCVHLYFAIYGVDMYTDISRKRACTADGTWSEDNTATYQTAIGLVIAFHVIEWLRLLVILSICWIGSDLTILYYGLSLNVVYGFVAMLVAIIMRYSGTGAECVGEGKQNERGLYLSLQILCIILYIFTCLHLQLIMSIKGADWCHEVVNEPEPDSDEEDEEEEDDKEKDE
jgi:apolipoprotein N-acyltransferase